MIAHDPSQSQSVIFDFLYVVRGINYDRDKDHLLKLIMESRIRALDYALSSLALGNCFAAGDKSTFRLGLETAIKDFKTALAPSFIWQFRYIVDRFEAFQDMIRIVTAFSYEEELVREPFKGTKAKSRMRQYLQHCWDYRLIDVGHCDSYATGKMKGEKLQAKSEFQSLGRRRDYNILHLMIEEDPTLLDDRDSFFLRKTRADLGEFVQPGKEKWKNRNQERLTSLPLVKHKPSLAMTGTMTCDSTMAIPVETTLIARRGSTN